MTQEKLSPMMLQWQTCKRQAKNALVLFRLGDFYEAFYEDAAILSKELQVTLTKRQEVPMAGIPFHASESYINTLVSKGYHVAIAEQMENAKETKGLVHRQIVRTITPGTVLSSALLTENHNNFLSCVCIVNQTFALSLLDVTTAQFFVMEFDALSSLCDELIRRKPKELLLSQKIFALHQDTWKTLEEDLSLCFSIREDWHFEHQHAVEQLTHHFGVHSLDGFGLQGMVAAINAAGCLLSYISDELHLSICHIQTIQKEISSQYMILDGATLRHLDILDSPFDAKGKNTLLYQIDQTCTPMGARLLRYWICHPLLSVEKIVQRQQAVEFFCQFPHIVQLRSYLGAIRDLERLIMRVETSYATPKDLHALGLSLAPLPCIKKYLMEAAVPLLQEHIASLSDISPIQDNLQKTLHDDPPLRISDGNIIREGVDVELDELKALCQDSQSWIASYQSKLREELGIKTLKVGYTKAFGYYIEISRNQSTKAPDFFERRQTLVNAERFITQDLKEYEHRVLSAEERISGIESYLFEKLRQEIARYGNTIRQIASAIAHIDCLASFAKVALEREYIPPVVNTDNILQIDGGKHPILDATLPFDTCIPNDVLLDNTSQQLLVITGPNMAGKSTFIRQVALIVILAQIGSFIPAQSAHIGIIDKLFTRIGASDNLAKGQSTFMIEMLETSNILHNATDRSLVILDEIGRGTSTYDGIALAWSIAEYLLSTKGKQAKTLFATHYYELTQLEDKIPGAKNYHIAVHETAAGLTFLRKILRGKADKSYGIHVAKLAGFPSSVLLKAQEMLKTLEKQSTIKIKSAPKEEQLSFFPLEHPIISQLQQMDPDQLSPIQALQQLLTWKTQI